MTTTPKPALTTSVPTAGTPVACLPGNIGGGWITNPSDAIGRIYVNPIDGATQTASGNTFALEPGQTWTAIPGQTTPTTINADADGQVVSAIYWD